MFAVELDKGIYAARHGGTCTIYRPEDIEWYPTAVAAAQIARKLDGEVASCRDMLYKIIRDINQERRECEELSASQ